MRKQIDDILPSLCLRLGLGAGTGSKGDILVTSADPLAKHLWPISKPVFVGCELAAAKAFFGLPRIQYFVLINGSESSKDRNREPPVSRKTKDGTTYMASCKSRLTFVQRVAYSLGQIALAIAFGLLVPTLGVGQTQYCEICQREYDAAESGTAGKLHAAMKLTDALYFFDLKAAKDQAEAASQMAKALSDEQAMAVCYMDRALISGWMEGLEEGEKFFNQAVSLFEEDARPEYRVHYYSALILFEIFRNSGEADLSDYFDKNEIASNECQDSHLVLHQHMMSVFNRVVLGQCSPDAPQIKSSLAIIRKLNRNIGLLDADSVLLILEAWEALAESDNDRFIVLVKKGLSNSRSSRNRLYQMFALGALAQADVTNNDLNSAIGHFEDALKLAEKHQSPPLILDGLVNLAFINFRLENYEAAKSQIERALNIQYLNSRTQSDRHAIYQLALDVYCAEDDIENVKKYASLLSSPEHMRAVVEANDRTSQLVQEIAQLKQSKLDAEREYSQTNSNMRAGFLVAQKKAETTIRILTGIAIALCLLGLGTALVVSRRRLSFITQRLIAEEESGRQGKEIQRGLESKLGRLQRMESLGLLAGGVAHDFNNLLVGVLGNAELLQLKPDCTEEYKQQRIDQIIQSAEEAAKLSHQMLAYAGKQQIKRKAADLNQLCKRMLPVFQSNVGAKSIELTADFWELPLVSEIDQTQIEQVLMNLVSNAIAASGDAGRIVIQTGCETVTELDDSLHGTRTTGGNFNYIEVVDFGHGISSQDLERVFEPFFTDKKFGRGLGLAVVYGMINGHNGLIRAESCVGGGSRFRILLPNALTSDVDVSAEFRKREVPLMEPIDSVQPTVLVVDDAHTVLELIQQHIHEKGWNVLVATNGMEALELIEDHKDEISCLLTDVVMPEMGAAELLAELEIREILLPVVLISGFSHTQLDEFRSDSQVVSVLQKPFRLDELLAAVEQASKSSDSGIAQTEPTR